MMRKFFDYFWGMIVRPKLTIEELAQETSIRYAVTLVLFGLALTLFNLLLFAVFGFDWLGTRRELPSPTYIGFFGRLSVDTDDYVTIFNFLINPLMALVGLIFIPGLAHLLAKVWRGSGTFEQMLNTIVFSTGVPSIVISSVLNDILLGGVLPNLLTGHPYAFTAAQTGEFGASVQTIWWFYMIGIYILAKDAWTIALGALAIRRIQKIPIWAAVLIMLFAYVLWFYGMAGTFVR
ncbi:MAG: hypothetical protein EDM79_12840 [Chloroflexi bacterium]|nr:MAG: hypothetical protein EDM79_12840 [Chloroflexota bacterium]